MVTVEGQLVVVVIAGMVVALMQVVLRQEIQPIHSAFRLVFRIMLEEHGQLQQLVQLGAREGEKA